LSPIATISGLRPEWRNLMEYLLVEFEEDRELVIDDAPTTWRTNETVYIEAGNHIISLVAPPENFRPSEIPVVMTGTSDKSLKTIEFTKIGVEVTSVVGAAPASASGKPRTSS
jgi:hypothetical protein